MDMSARRRTDLHIHSTASDGSLTPSELVELARSRGISCMAITDHDTLDGLPEGMEAAEEHGMTLVPGVELSTDLPEGGSAHLLGYFPGVPLERLMSTGTELGRALERVQKGRERRNPEILARLSAVGVEISLDRVREIAGGELVGRPHIAAALVESGYVSGSQEAFDRYLARGKPAYVERDRLDIADAVKMLRSAGGLPVMAHPAYIPMERDRLFVFLSSMTGMGLAGIEAFYPKHGEELTAWLLGAARRMGIFVTGGTDFHGWKKDGTPLGGDGNGFTVTEGMVGDFLSICRDRIGGRSEAHGEAQ